MEGHKNGMTELLNAIGLNADKAHVVAKIPAQKHYGVWHPERGWWWANSLVFTTTNRAVAFAQLDCVRQVYAENTLRDGWRVRCIEDWAMGTVVTVDEERADE